MMSLSKEQICKLMKLNFTFSESNNYFSDAQIAIGEVLEVLGIEHSLTYEGLTIPYNNSRNEKWREYYHEDNIDKELPCDDLKCYGCFEPFDFNEMITFINTDPYCSENCFLSNQAIDDSWSTSDVPAPEDKAKEYLKTCTKEQIKAIKTFIEIMELEVKVDD